MNLGERIRQCRRQKNLSQEKLAELIDVHSNTIRKWEKGISIPNAEELRMLANALGVSTAYLYEEVDNGNPNFFLKNSEYQDKTEIRDSVPTMAYWGSLVDNAEKAAESQKNINVIITLVKTALQILENTTMNSIRDNISYMEIGA